MILRYGGLNIDYEMCDEKLNVFIIESPDHFDDFTNNIFKVASGEEAIISLIKENKEISFAKEVDVIFGPINLDVSGTPFKKKLYSSIMDELSDEIYEQYNEIETAILQMLENINLKIQYDIEYEFSTGINAVFDSFKVRQKRFEGRFIERIIDYIKLVHKIQKKNIFIIVNCLGYLKKEDYKYLEELINYENVSITLVDSKQPNLDIVTNTVIIDEDLCEI